MKYQTACKCNDINSKNTSNIQQLHLHSLLIMSQYLQKFLTPSHSVQQKLFTFFLIMSVKDSLSHLLSSRINWGN